jgi:2-polyprenyl-6-methoxyphenol hydroxylase-like FAD-dependent oxidoreductase
VTPINKRVLISGLGIAGPTLAYWLKAGGFEPILIERAPKPRTDGYVIDFWGLGYDIAEQMGLGPDINRLGYHMRELRIIGDHGGRLAGFGVKVFDELTDGRFITLGRSDLSGLLFDAIRGETEVVFGDEIVDLREDADGVRVKFKHGRERRFDLVIGADGLHSDVRRLVFGAEAHFETPLGYGVAAFEVAGYVPHDEDIYLLYGQPGRMVGRFTLREDRTLFLFIFVTDRGALPTTRDAQKAMLRAVYADGKWECPKILEELDRADSLYFDSISQIRMDRWWSGRVALVGDAAFCVSLAAGQGAALAMTSAYVLAGELAKAQGRHREAFAAYEGALRDYVAAKQSGAERFALAFAPKTHWGMVFRNQVVRAFVIPGLARFALGREIIDALQLPQYPWASLCELEA